MQLLRRHRERKIQTSHKIESDTSKTLSKENLHHNLKPMATALAHSPLPKNPASPHMSNEGMRIASFRFNGIWDYSKLAATPEQLATAGFYYLGHSDRVQCYYCNGALESWDYSDDPWVEHTKWYPCCEYVLSRKGPDFVAGIVSRFPDISRPDPKKIRDAPPEAFLKSGNPFVSTRVCASDGIFDPQPRRKHVDTCVKNAMDKSTYVKRALELGIDENQIRKALRRQYEMCDDEFSTLDELLDALDNIDEHTPFKSDRSADSATTAPVTRAESSERECKICYDTEADVVFVPCGHLTTCENCAIRVHKCPICRSRIQSKIKTYTS